jgi:hypothetical protein
MYLRHQVENLIYNSLYFVCFRCLQVMHWTPADYLETGLVFAFHVGYRWILPFACLPFWHALAIFMVAEVSASLGFVLQFVVNHEVCGQSVQGKAGRAPFVPQGYGRVCFVQTVRIDDRQFLMAITCCALAAVGVCSTS